MVRCLPVLYVRIRQSSAANWNQNPTQLVRVVETIRPSAQQQSAHRLRHTMNVNVNTHTHTHTQRRTNARTIANIKSLFYLSLATSRQSTMQIVLMLAVDSLCSMISLGFRCYEKCNYPIDSLRSFHWRMEIIIQMPLTTDYNNRNVRKSFVSDSFTSHS